MAPNWGEQLRWYAIYPLGMTGAPLRDEIGADRLFQEPSHRLNHLINWLDHVVALGCNGLLLGPIFASVSHGYDTLDHFRIDPRLGDEADFLALIEAAHDRGLKVICDGVFNHVSQDHPIVVETLAAGPEHDRGMIHVDWTANPPTRLNFEGSDDLVRLNHGSPLVADLVADVMNYWLARGIDGWRLDAAYAVPADFWAAVLGRVRTSHPEALFIGEVIHADLDWIKASTIDSITAYELWKAAWSSIKDQNFFELDWALTRFVEFAAANLPVTFVSNHDVNRIASQIGPEAGLMAWAITCVAPGMPAVYYGDEAGIAGVKYEREHGDDEIRPALPPSPSEWVLPEPWLVPEYQMLLRLREQNPWLARATREAVSVENRRIAYRWIADGHDALVVLDLDGRVGIDISVAGQKQYSWPPK